MIRFGSGGDKLITGCQRALAERGVCDRNEGDAGNDGSSESGHCEGMNKRRKTQVAC